ncbi:MAG: Glu/Leu/Phe/Val dehydrogenase dimerization domain-containing protein, partial [Thermoanaerobaculia bacterium]
MLELLAGWDGLGVFTSFDRATGTWIFVALHDGRLGRPTGGTRLKVYPTPDDGLTDALRLAAGMTAKWAALELPMGGGKAVLAAPRPLAGEERRGLLTRYGSLVESLAGAFATGEDLGTTPEDMRVLAEVTRWVHVFPDAPDPGPFTALGVYHGIRAALAARLGNEDPAGRRVLIQGVGDVGAPLAELLAAAGATLLLSDVDEPRAAALASRLDAEVVSPAQLHETPCDVYAPCATGAVLNEETIARLGCAIVAGAANNQLAAPADAERLHARGILYAPDYVINGGGALAFGLLGLG